MVSLETEKLALMDYSQYYMDLVMATGKRRYSSERNVTRWRGVQESSNILRSYPLILPNKSKSTVKTWKLDGGGDDDDDDDDDD